MINKDGRGQFFDFMGGDTAVMRGDMGVPPLGKTLQGRGSAQSSPPPFVEGVGTKDLRTGKVKLSQLSYYVCCCYGISVYLNNYNTSRRQKRFHTI